jgi:methylase of polypeptide subunit release factors
MPATLHRRFFRSRLAARLLLRVDPGPPGPDDVCFDATTPVLVRRALRRLPPGSRVLDLGTGASAVVGLALWKRGGHRVTAADVEPELVRSARESVRRSGAPIAVVRSRFFDAVEVDALDAVVFNPPYVPTAAGERRGLPASRRSQWDGGGDGAAVVREFCTELAALGRRLPALVGVNRRHLPRALVEAAVAAAPPLRVERVWRGRLLPVDIYELAVPPSSSDPRG